ncbi:MAG: antibiotic biosynthesis monooxygenase [Steroidobacteraceae bacterium]
MSSTSATLLIQHRVRPGQLARYEAWLRHIVTRASAHPGHQGVHVLRPPEGGNEYSIVIRYQSAAHASRWLESAERRQLLEEIEDALELGDRVEIRPGIEFWFTPPPSVPASRVAPRWKQWLVTTSVIWPLTMIVPLLLGPLFDSVPFLGQWILEPWTCTGGTTR